MKPSNSTSQSFRFIFLLYIYVICGFAILYMLPHAHNGKLSFIDALFVSTSSLSVTGLSSIDIATDFTRTGQALLMLEMQLGGIGILVIMSYLFLLLGKKMTVSNMLLISKDQNQSNLKTIKTLSFSVLFIAIFIETICYFIIYEDIESLYNDKSEAIFVSAFHAVSSFTNAGFTLFDLHSFEQNGVFLLATAFTIFLGSIGFPTIMEYTFAFRKKKSLFSKINVRLHTSLFLIGAILYVVLEFNRAFGHLNLVDKFVNAIFLSATTRSGGLATIDSATLGTTTVLIVMCFMFIGGASSSTGGGIRLTTFRVIIARIISVVRNDDQVIIGRKAISQEAVNKSFLIFTSFVVLSVISTIILTLFQSQNLLSIGFEVLSAISNTGLSMGITDELASVSKLILIFLMIIGRIGIFTFIYFIFKVEKSKLKYLEEDLAVG